MLLCMHITAVYLITIHIVFAQFLHVFFFLPGGLQVTNKQEDEQFHFLVFTDVLGNKTYGAVMQCFRPIVVHFSTCNTLHTPTKFFYMLTGFYCYDLIVKSYGRHSGHNS